MIPYNQRIYPFFRVFAVVLVLAAFSVHAAGKSAAVSTDVGRVLKEIAAKLAGVKTVQTDFVQKKELSVFKRTMVIKGELAVKKPGDMVWRVTEPVKYTVVIRGTHLQQWDEDTNRVQKLNMAKDPTFKAVFDQLRIWFSGRYSALTDTYHVTVVRTDPYVLEFTPKKGTMYEKVIKSVRIELRKDERYIKALTIEEGSGDRTVIEFHNTRLNVPLGKSTWEVRPR